MGAFLVACSFRSIDDNFEWAFAGVYGPNDNNDGKMLLDELSGLISW